MDCKDHKGSCGLPGSKCMEYALMINDKACRYEHHREPYFTQSNKYSHEQSPGKEICFQGFDLTHVGPD